jgi:hypothetical protein
MSENLKIPIVAGVNDNPIPPNFNNNLRGPNGSYVSAKHNLLVDVVVANASMEYPQFVANAPRFLELGEPLTTISAPLLLSYSLNSNIKTYGKYYQGSSEQSMVQLTGLKIEPDGVYEYVYPNLQAQPNAYLVPHQRVFELRVFEEGSDFELSRMRTQVKVDWAPRIFIRGVVGDSEPSEIWSGFELPIEAITKPETLEPTQVKLWLPRFVDGIQCNPEVIGVTTKIGESVTQIVPQYEIVEENKTSSIGLGYNIEYWVYDLGSATTLEAKYWISFPNSSGGVPPLILTPTNPSWEVIEW